MMPTNATLKHTSNTNYIGGAKLTLDYVLVSFVNAAKSDIIPYLLDDEMATEFQILDSHMRGFNHAYTNKQLFVHYDNKGDKPVVVFEARSQGCRFLEKQEDHSWTKFFERIISIGNHVALEKINFKRLDIAIDSFKADTLSTVRVRRYLGKCLVTSRLQVIRYVQEVRISSNLLVGDSVYFGKRTSDLSILVYDKKMENRSFDLDVWYRVETRLGGKRADKAITSLIQEPADFGCYVSNLLSDNLQFRSERHIRSEIRRRSFASWYTKYLETVSGLRLNHL